MFALKRDVRADRRVQLYCDGEQHIEVTHPLYEHSGEPCGIEASKCDCPKAEEPEVDPNAGESTQTDPTNEASTQPGEANTDGSETQSA